MNQNIKFFLFCPVPEDQKPINEYLILKENESINWIFLSKNNYFKSLLKYFFISFLLLIPFSFLISKNYLNIIFVNFLIQILLSIFFLLVLIVRWFQLYKKFNNSRLFYEEASWYDGQIWEKPLEIIKNDHLLLSQKINPIFKKLNFSIFILFSITIFFVLLFK